MLSRASFIRIIPPQARILDFENRFKDIFKFILAYTISLFDELGATAIQDSTVSPSLSRTELLRELESLGINTGCLQTLTVDQLSNLLYDLNKAANRNATSKASHGNAKDAADNNLSAIDKKMLKALLESHGSPSSLQLSRDLQIPISTVLRRRKRLMEQFIRHSYSLRYEAFARRNITFIISLGAGNRSQVVREILSLKGVTSITRTFGDGLDLMIEAVVEENEELVELSEKIRSVQGVQRVSFFECLEVLEKNKEVDLALIDSV
jgi:DNA-binding Lrp family transcriptional regulator